jgi:hypothetical protein
VGDPIYYNPDRSVEELVKLVNIFILLILYTFIIKNCGVSSEQRFTREPNPKASDCTGQLLRRHDGETGRGHQQVR